jgi:hypothetical protein
MQSWYGDIVNDVRAHPCDIPPEESTNLPSPLSPLQITVAQSNTLHPRSIPSPEALETEVYGLKLWLKSHKEKRLRTRSRVLYAISFRHIINTGKGQRREAEILARLWRREVRDGQDTEDSCNGIDLHDLRHLVEEDILRGTWNLSSRCLCHQFHPGGWATARRATLREEQKTRVREYLRSAKREVRIEMMEIDATFLKNLTSFLLLNIM